MALTAVDALRAIERELATTRADTVPPGWRTSDQWAAETQRDPCTVGKILRAGVDSGIVERRQFRIVTGRGVCKVWHYRTKAAS